MGGGGAEGVEDEAGVVGETVVVADRACEIFAVELGKGGERFVDGEGC